MRFTRRELVVVLRDGRTLCVPLRWFPRLATASAPQRRRWKLLGRGEGIHWPALDEDLSVAGLLRGVPAPRVPRRARSGSAPRRPRRSR